jgi:hypothetical protein
MTTYRLLRHLRKVAPFSRYAVAEILPHSEEAASRGLQVPIPFEDCLHKCFLLAVTFMETYQTSYETRQLMFHLLIEGGYSSLLIRVSPTLRSHNAAKLL